MSRLQQVHAGRPDRPVVVFIHGLGGDMFDTWVGTGTTADDCWPHWVGQDTDCDTWVLGYDAAISRWQDQAMSLIDQGVHLAHRLGTQEGTAGRDLVLIGHSMGGLLIKKMVVQGMTLDDSTARAVALRVRGVVFVATPHQGSALASLVQALSQLTRPNPQMEALRNGDGALLELNRQFGALRKKLAIAVWAFAERRDVEWKTGGWWPLPGKVVQVRVVSDSSGDPGLEGVTAVPLLEDHFSICKPADRNSLVHVSVCKFINQLIAESPSSAEAGQLNVSPVSAQMAETPTSVTMPSLSTLNEQFGENGSRPPRLSDPESRLRHTTVAAPTKKRKRGKVARTPASFGRSRASVSEFTSVVGQRKLADFLESALYQGSLVEGGGTVEDEIARAEQSPLVRHVIAGPSGVGKTVALLAYFLNHAQENPKSVYLSASDLQAVLLEDDVDLKSENDTHLFVDGLDTAHPAHDNDRAKRIAEILFAHRYVVVTATSDYLLRSDVENHISRRLLSRCTLVQWDTNRAAEYLNACCATTGARDFVARCTDVHGRVSPLIVAMSATLKDEPTPLGLAAVMGRAYLETSVYHHFTRQMVQRELGQSGDGEPAQDLERTVKGLHRIAAAMHGGRTKQVISEVSRTKGIRSLLASPDEVAVQFVHPSLVDYFCADAMWREAQSNVRDLSSWSPLFLPASYRINAFVRAFMDAASHRERTQAASRLEALYWHYLAKTVSVGTILPEDYLRNNSMYAVGRLAKLGAPIPNFETIYASERHPLVKYTVGMNGILNGCVPLHEKILDSTMNPRNDDQRLICDANLACHLYYYGDISGVELPDEGSGTVWSGTLAGLGRHFEAMAEPSYQSFWLIDLITIVQLFKRFTPTNNRAARESLVRMLHAVSTIATNVGPLANLAKKVVDYVHHEVELDLQ